MPVLEYRLGAFGVQGIYSRGALIKIGKVALAGNICDYTHAADILRLERIEALKEANGNNLLIKNFYWSETSDDSKQQHFYDVHSDDDYEQLIRSIVPDKLTHKLCHLCNNEKNLVPAIDGSYHQNMHCECYDKIVQILQAKETKLIEFIRYELPHWIEDNISSNVRKEVQLCDIICYLLKRVWSRSTNGEEEKDNIALPPLCFTAVPLTQQAEKTLQLTSKIDCIVEQLFQPKQNEEQSKEMVHDEINKSKQLNAGWLSLDYCNNGPNAVKSIKFGAWTVDLDRPSHIQLIQFIIECSRHASYSSKLEDKLTKIKINNEWIDFEMEYYDDSRKIAIINAFGEKNLHEMICFLCADPLNPTYGVGTINNVAHSRCVRKLHLPHSRFDSFFSAHFVDLPKELKREAKEIPNLIVARQSLINEALGKAFDQATNGKYIKSRQVLFGKGMANDDKKFDWTPLRLVGKSTFDWDKMTDFLAMQLLGLHIANKYDN